MVHLLAFVDFAILGRSVIGRGNLRSGWVLGADDLVTFSCAVFRLLAAVALVRRGRDATVSD